jgi:two-component SAPR family response regulator
MDENKYNINTQKESNIQDSEYISIENNNQKIEQTYTSNFDKWCKNPQDRDLLTYLFLHQKRKETQFW